MLAVRRDMTARGAPWNHDSIADIPERKLVARLMQEPHWRERLTGIHGIASDSEYALEVPLTGLPEDPECDIDILLVPPSCPEISTAVQVKRVKVSEKSFDSGTPNRLSELERGYGQANLMARIGFSQVYLFVIVVVDSRRENPAPPSYKGLNAGLRTTIESAISTRQLLPAVGMLRFEFVQPMDTEPLTVGTSSTGLVRLATQVEQPRYVTEWVRASMARMRA
jgi:hypothetical protein